MLGGRCAGVVRQDAELRADGQVRRGARGAGTQGDDAMLLVGRGDEQVGDHPALDIADDSVALVHVLTGGAAVA